MVEVKAVVERVAAAVTVWGSVAVEESVAFRRARQADGMEVAARVAEAMAACSAAAVTARSVAAATARARKALLTVAAATARAGQVTPVAADRAPKG